ncbi:hypothetical protein SAMN05216490_3124 [Mucilaginibacter mallensis]|uniref:Uncharacterized protein n=1 Tax=Mucilaginibacter mallensis TaxID=652787 RepID=A0A1H1ZI52_MUCMA|nr:hypothetical protein SAMN05216490_3124 [Mucilaginibacter mallensis]
MPFEAQNSNVHFSPDFRYLFENKQVFNVI